MFNLAGMDKILQLSQNFEEKEIDIGIYKRYVIAMLFYAYLSIKEEKYLNEELNEQNITFEEAYKNDKIRNTLEEKSLQNLGYFIKPEETFKKVIKDIKENNFSVDNLEKNLTNIKKSFRFKHPNKEGNIFNLIDWSRQLVILTKHEQTELISELLLKISENEYLESNTESFIKQLYKKYESDQKDYNYINSYHVNELIYKLIGFNGKTYKKVFDITANLDRVDDLLDSGRRITTAGLIVENLTCTCIDEYNYNLTNMYPVMYELEKDLQIIKKSDINYEDNEKYDLIIGTITGYEQVPETYTDKEIKVSRQKHAHSNIEKLLLKLENEGIMTIIIPTDYLFNKNSQTIKYMENNTLDTIINLPEFNNHKYSILIFKEKSEDTLLIDATYLPNFKLHKSTFFKGKTASFFYHPDIRKKIKYILKTYSKREEMENFSHIITKKELKTIKSLENYSIIHVKEEEDNIDSYEKQLKSHRFPAPPWIKFPTIPLGSMGWRMGFGEDYIMRYEDYIDDLNLYRKLFPRPKTWKWIRYGDKYISQELKDFMKYSGGKYKFFTSDGKPTYNIKYGSEDEYIKINDTELDLRFKYSFRFAIQDYNTAYEFIEEEKDKDWGIKGKPSWDEVKYTLCLNANYSKIVSDKKLVDKLLETENKVILYFDDSPWGVQKDNEKIVGENLQGLALMQIRDEIRKVYENYDIIDWDISNYM